MKRKFLLSSLSALSLVLAVPLRVMADTAEAAEAPSLLFQAGNIIIFLVLVINLILGVKLIKAFGRGVLNIAFISFSFAMLFVAFSRIFTTLQDMGVYNLSDVTLHTWWHLIFYFAAFSIIWGGWRLKKIVDTGVGFGWGTSDKLFYGTLLVLTLIVFLIAAPMESTLSPMITGSIIDTMGLHHFGAFIAAFAAGWYIFYIKGHWGILGLSMTFIVAFMVLMGVQHFWELLTESWKVVILEDAIIEQVEQFIVLPSVILYGVGLWKMIRAVKV